MPPDAARKKRRKPPGGKRPTAAEEERRLAAVEKLLVDGSDVSTVAASMAKRFGIAERTSKDYIAKVRRRWVESASETLELERAAAVKRIREISRRASEDSSYTAAIQAERLLSDILGYSAPKQQKVEVSSPAGQPAGVVVYLPQIERVEDDTTALEGQAPSGDDAAGSGTPSR